MQNYTGVIEKLECLKHVIIKDTLPLIPLKILPLVLDALVLFLPLSEAALEVLSEHVQLCCCGCLDNLN